MKKFITRFGFALVSFLPFPLLVKASVIYTFHYALPQGGTLGFVYTAPDYLTLPVTAIDVSALTSCDTSGSQGGRCLSASLFSSMPDYPFVIASMKITEPHAEDPNDTENPSFVFPNASLLQAGTYSGVLRGTTLTVDDRSADVAAPEPATLGLFGTALLSLWAFCRSRKREDRQLLCADTTGAYRSQ